MNNFDYYGTKITDLLLSDTGCGVATVYNEICKASDVCAGKSCEDCKNELKAWLNEPYTKITTKEKLFLESLSKDVYQKIVRAKAFFTLNGIDRSDDIVLSEDMFKFMKTYESFSIEELLEREVA